MFLGLSKRKHFDPFVCAELCDQSTTESYSKAGKIIANKIIFPTDTTTNKYLNNFYSTGLDPFDYVQKETSYL